MEPDINEGDPMEALKNLIYNFRTTAEDSINYAGHNMTNIFKGKQMTLQLNIHFVRISSPGHIVGTAIYVYDIAR